MSEHYEVGDGPAHDSADWVALLVFQARRNLLPPPPTSLAATLDSPERATIRLWVGHALLTAAHDGACGCCARHEEWMHAALELTEAEYLTLMRVHE